MKLELCPVSLSDAMAFVGEVHRHHQPPVGGKFAVAVGVGEEVVGVAICGRPVARRLDDGWTIEVTRVAVKDGFKNACSMLYGACWRAARSLGYRKCITYTLNTEPGTSLKAAGWRVVGTTPGRSWSVPSRPRVDKHPLQQKIRWEPSGAEGDG